MAEYDKTALRAAVIARQEALGGISQRDAAAKARVPLSAINRARAGQPVGAANYVLICDWVALDPYALILAEEGK
jgi:hypothetical protein